jgi:hypothetical protein
MRLHCMAYIKTNERTPNKIILTLTLKTKLLVFAFINSCAKNFIIYIHDVFPSSFSSIYMDSFGYQTKLKRN